MVRAKIKKVKLPIGSADDNLTDMFNQMLGTGAVNLKIAYPRYKRMYAICNGLVKLFEMVVKSPFIANTTEFIQQRDELTKFCAESREEITNIFDVDLGDYESNFSLVSEELQKKFSESYERVKTSSLVKTFIIMCDRLVKYKNNFKDMDHLNHKFLHSMAGSSWCPFPFTTLNIKYIVSLDINMNTIMFFMTVLSKAFELSFQLFNELQSPDIDVDVFSEIIISKIDSLQNRPEVNRCGRAFKKIKESIGLLKGNFNSYYRDFIATKDNTIIMQHFILDITKETNPDPKLMMEFKHIIKYYRKLAQEQIADPKIKSLFGKVDETFKQMERNTENLVHIDKDEASEGEPAAQTETLHKGISLKDLETECKEPK